jgi:hypothetical protein
MHKLTRQHTFGDFRRVKHKAEPRFRDAVKLDNAVFAQLLL